MDNQVDNQADNQVVNIESAKPLTKLNLGCGQRQLKGYINVDQNPGTNPDVTWNLEDTPWPFKGSTIAEIVLDHVLEHLGQATATYLAIIKELYRVCQDQAIIKINVPHPRHDIFLIDPTHVRPITPEGLNMFSKKANDQDHANGGQQTPLAYIVGVDFEITGVTQNLDLAWDQALKQNKVSIDQVREAAKYQNNIVQEFSIIMKVLKPSKDEAGTK